MNHATAYIAYVILDMRIPHAASLKNKRKVIKGLKDRLRARFNASVAEIDYLDDWQRSVVGITMISNERRHLEQGYSLIKQMLVDVTEIELVEVALEWL